MMTADQFAAWCLKLKLGESARALITRIRTSPPSRRVQSRTGNVCVRYPSKKMGVTIQAESHRNELPLIVEMEHDPAVLEYYDQPSPIKLVYELKSGRKIAHLHTPDFFVLRSEAAGWTECKLEEALLALCEKNPTRYVRTDPNSWSCPPAERVAQQYGFFYKLRSSAEINWILQANLTFLEDYFR